MSCYTFTNIFNLLLKLNVVEERHYVDTHNWTTPWYQDEYAMYGGGRFCDICGIPEEHR